MNLRIALLLLCIPIESYSQNLIPNPGFEEVTGCPGASVFLKNTVSWSGMSNHKGTPDQFYGDCSYNGITNSMAPGQLPYSGIGYVGGFCYGDDLREYITAELTEPMVIDSVYKLEFFVLPASGYGTAINSYGVHFSVNAPKGDGTLKTMRYAEHIGNPTDRLITDTVNWTMISGEYRAKGGERYITFGNFREDCNTQANVIKEKCIRPDRSYMLLDGVVVRLKSDDQDLEEQPFYVDRKLKQAGEFITDEVSIKLSVWDHMKVDRDSIYLLIDDSILVQDYEITKKKLKLTITLEKGMHTLQFIAVNLGSIPPNTCTIRLSDGIRRKEFILNSNLKETECLKIIVE